MTFGGHIVYFWPAWAQMMLRGAQINYISDKSHVIIIVLTQGQIVQIYFIKKDGLNMKSLCGLQIPFTAQPFSADKLGYLMTQTLQPFYRYCKSTHLFYSIDKGLFLSNSLDLHCASPTARNKISFNGCALNYWPTHYYFVDGCRRLKFLPLESGCYLRDHVFLNLTIGVHTACHHRCVMESRCVSVNIGRPVNDKVVCELSDSDHIQHPQDLKPRQGWTYRGITEVGQDKTFIIIIVQVQIVTPLQNINRQNVMANKFTLGRLVENQPDKYLCKYNNRWLLVNT